MKKRFSKFLALALAMIMIVTAMPVSALSFGGGSMPVGGDMTGTKPDEQKPEGKTYTAVLDNGVTVEAFVPAGAFSSNRNIKMVAEAVEDVDAVQAAVDQTEGVQGTVLAAVDITFYKGKNEVQPSKPVSVTIKSDDFAGKQNLSVVHLDIDSEELGDAEVEAEPVSGVTVGDGDVVFNARSFSIYATIEGSSTTFQVDFYSDSNEHLNRQIVLTSTLTPGNSPVYDPGMPSLGENQAFGGWVLTGTAPAGFETGKTYTINKINEILIENASSYTSTFTMSFRADVEDVVFVSYTDQNGVVWKTDAVPLNHTTYGDFIYDANNFAPEGQNVGLVGWVVMFEDQQATGYVVEDNDQGASFKYKVVDNAPYAAPGSEGEAYHELILYPLVKSGQWIYFNANIGTADTTPATYTAPRFIADGETPNGKKPANPDRDGYTFAEWYTDASCTTAFNWSDENWTSQLTNNTVYANWTAKSVSYKVIYWTQNRNDDTGLSNSAKTWDYYVPTAAGVVTSGTAPAGSTVTLTSSTSGKTAYNRLGRNSETYSGRTANGELGYYFKFNEPMTETSKVIRGDGTTVFNVYYDRAKLTINFYNSSSASTATYTYSGLYEHDWDGYPSLSSSYTWKYDDPNDNKTYILTSGTAPTVFKSFQSCTETWNIYRASASSWDYSSPIYYRRQALNGNYVLYRQDDLCTDYTDSDSSCETQYIRGNEFFGFTGVGYNATTNSTTASSYHTFTANDSGDYPLIFNGYQIYSYGINIYYARNKWTFDYYSNGTTYHANNGNKIYFEDNISSLGSFIPTNGPEGHYFTGWYKDPECTKPYTFSGTEAKMPNNDVLVYAGWEPEWYRIVFDLTDGGKVDPATIVIPSDASHPTGQDPTFTVVYGTKLDGACLTKVSTTSGLTFGGWFYDADHNKPFSFETLIGPNIPEAGDPDGMNMKYATAPDSERQDQSNYWKPWSDVGYPAVRGKLVLYPLWRQKVVGSDGIQVRYDAVEGKGLIYVGTDGQVIRYDPFTYTDGALAFTRYSATPNDNGEQFLYWEILDKNGNVVRTVYPGETFPVNLEWAVAEPTRPTYTITWHYRDANGNWTTVETTVFEGDIPTHSAPAWDDGTYLYEFSSWNTAQDGSGTTPVAADADADYYAQYTQTALPAKYTVTFKDWDGTTLDTQTVYAGHDATAPANPTRTGYTFSGWDVAFTNVQSNLTVTAQYTINSYTLTINYVDGDNNAVATAYTGTYEFGASYSVTSPTVENYTTEQTVVAGTMPANNVTINVVYTGVNIVKVYELVTTVPSDWSDNYVITYGTDTSMYILKGAAGSANGTGIESTSYAIAYASSGITLDGTKLKNVANDYVFTLAPSGNYYSVKSVSQGSYLGLTSDYALGAYSSLDTTYCRWTPGYFSTNASSMYNANSSTSYPLLSFNTSNYYFWSGSVANQSTNAQNVRLWKETTESGSSTPSVTWTQVTGLSSGTYYTGEAGHYYRFVSGGNALTNASGTTVSMAADDATDSAQWWMAEDSTVSTTAVTLLKNVKTGYYLYYASNSTDNYDYLVTSSTNSDGFRFYGTGSTTVYIANTYLNSSNAVANFYVTDKTTYLGGTTSSSGSGIMTFTVYKSNETFNASVQPSPASREKSRSASEVNNTKAAGDYVKITSLDELVSGGQYLIVCENNNVAFNGGLTSFDVAGNNISVTISNNTIAASTAVDDASFTITASGSYYTIKSASGYYIGATSTTSNTLLSSTSTAYNNAISFNNGSVVIQGMNGTTGARYLRYNSSSNQRRFRYYTSTSQQAIQLYKKTAAAVPCTVTYMANGAQVGTAEATVGGTVTLPTTATAVNGYEFIGWVTTAQPTETTTEPTFYAPGATSGTLTGDTTFYALYRRTESGGSSETVYQRVTSDQTDWTGNYVISYGSDAARVLKGSSSDSTTIESTSYASTLSAAGITLDGDKLRNVGDLYVFYLGTIEGDDYTGYYCIQNLSTSGFVSMYKGTSDTYTQLYNYTSLYTTGIWLPTFVSGNGNVTLTNYYYSVASANNYCYFSFDSDNNYFYTGSSSGTNTSSIYLWKETEISNDTNYYTTAPVTTYTVTWQDANGNVIETDNNVASGAHPEFNGTTPTKPADANYTYSFAGWKVINTSDSEIVNLATYAVTGNVTFVPVFTATPIATPTHTLTIYYVYAGGGTAATTYTATYAEGASYSVTSPTVEGYTPNKAVVSGTMGSSDVTETVTYTQNGGGQTTQMWTPTDTIVPGEPYLIGFVVDGVVYLAVNDGEHYDNDYSYYGYTARATLDSDNVISAHVTGLNDINGRYTDLASCQWTFSTATGGLIQSTANNKYLGTYSSTSYNDLYAQTGTSYATGWYYDASQYSLSRQISGTTVYAAWYYSHPTGDTATINGTYMGISTDDPTTDDVYIQLYSLKDVVEGETYTVTFSYYNENGEYVTVTHNNVAYGTEITPPEVPERPGYTFDGWDSEGYLGVTESHDYVAQYIQNGSMTYTVYLRAVYGTKNTTGKTAIVLNPNGLTFKDQTEGTSILNRSTNNGVTAWGTYGDITLSYSSSEITLSGLDINGSVNLPNGDLFVESQTHGYKIVGWNTRPDGTGMWVKFDGTGDITWGSNEWQRVYIDNLDRTNVNTHVNTLYAMWEGYSYVYNSADNTIDRYLVRSTDIGTRVTEKFDLPAFTAEKSAALIANNSEHGVLYGGYSTTYYGGLISGTTGTIGWASDNITASVTNGKAYNPDKAYASGFNKWWKTANMATADGRNITPAIGQVYYVKQVPNTYLVLKFQYVYFNVQGDDYGKIRQMWAVTPVDDKNYSEVGFIVDENTTDTKEAELVSSFTITSSNGGEPKTITVKNFPGLKLGWVGYADCGLETDSNGFILPIAQDDALTYCPYWITYDGVMVFSVAPRTFYCTDGTMSGLADIK